MDDAATPCYHMTPLSYLANESLYPVMHHYLFLHGKSRVICTLNILKLTWPSTHEVNAFCSMLAELREI